MSEDLAIKNSCTFQAQILNLDGVLLAETIYSPDKDKICFLVDAINHTHGSKLRALVNTRGGAGVALDRPVRVS